MEGPAPAGSAEHRLSLSPRNSRKAASIKRRRSVALQPVPWRGQLPLDLRGVGCLFPPCNSRKAESIKRRSRPCHGGASSGWTFGAWVGFSCQPSSRRLNSDRVALSQAPAASPASAGGEPGEYYLCDGLHEESPSAARSGPNPFSVVRVVERTSRMEGWPLRVDAGPPPFSLRAGVL